MIRTENEKQTQNDRYSSSVSMELLSERLIHKLRNPLSVITTASSQLECDIGKPLAEDDISFLSTIITAAEDLEKILKKYHYYSASLQLDEHKSDLNDICRSEYHAALCRLQKKNYGAFGVIDCDKSVPRILCDSNKLRVAIQEIITNAIEELDKINNAKLILRTKYKDDLVTITIEDNGAGIPKEIGSTAFCPFVTARPGKSGLGLAIAKKIIEESGGSIDMNSSSSDGTEININIPYRKE